jgi:hypothetical protein
MPHDTDTGPSELAIRERSYYIWVSEGFPEGKDHEHWLRAKAELEAEEEAHRRAEAALSGSPYFVMPRPLISAPPRRTTAMRIDPRKDALRA